jgi:hypothetical protein
LTQRSWLSATAARSHHRLRWPAAARPGRTPPHARGRPPEAAHPSLALVLGSGLTVVFVPGPAPGLRPATYRSKHPLDEVKKPARIVLVPAIAQLKSVKPREPVKLGGQLLLPKRPGVIDQHRNHPHTAFQRRLDLEAHIVVGIVEPPPPLLIGHRRPLAPDQGHQHRA